MLHAQKCFIDYTKEVVNLVEGTPLTCDAFTQATHILSTTELLVPVVGGFSAGKSSFVNGFLQQDILAVGLTSETELATEIRYGTDSHLVAIHTDGRHERVELENMPDIKSRAKEFSHLRLYLDNPHLKQYQDLILVDMPGFESSLENHNKAIAHYLPCGVHFIVVTSIEDGNVTRSMLCQLDEINTYGHSFTYVLNKTNLRADEQVDEVAALIEDQLEQAVVRIDLNGRHEQMTNILNGLNPEKIFRDMFIGQLKDMTQAMLSQIGVALVALDKSQEENQRAQTELEKGVRKLMEKRDDLILRVCEKTLGRVVERCVSELGSALENAREELVNAGLSGNQQNFSHIASDVIRTTLARVVNEEMRNLSHDVVHDLSGAISELGESLAGFSQDQNWLEQMTDRINRGLEHTGTSLQSFNTWAESAAQSSDHRKVFQGVATALAVVTSVVNPLIELAIIFLPSILEFFQKSRKRDEFRQKIVNEIVPSIKQKMRDELTAQLSQQIEEMINDINANFEHELEEKKRIMEQMQTEQGGTDIEQQKLHLADIKNKLQQLAEKALYQE